MCHGVFWVAIALCVVDWVVCMIWPDPEWPSSDRFVYSTGLLLRITVISLDCWEAVSREVRTITFAAFVLLVFSC